MSKAADTAKEISPSRILEFDFMFVGSRVLATALELDLFSKINEGIREISMLAKVLKASERGVGILLNALSGMKLVENQSGQWFLMSEAEAFLVKGKPSYLGGILIFHDDMWNKWKHLTDVVKTGKPVVAVESDEDNGEFFVQLVEHLFALNYPAAKCLGEYLGIGTKISDAQVLDVGAGSGVWGIAQAELGSKVKVTAQDRATVLDVAKRMVETRKLNNQFSYLPGNFRELDFGNAEYNLIILGHICHSEGRLYTQSLFKKCYKALKQNGVLAIAEWVPDKNRKESLLPLLFGVNMLMHTEEGDVFTFEEYSIWLKESGFKRVEELDAPSASPLILAYR